MSKNISHELRITSGEDGEDLLHFSSRVDDDGDMYVTVRDPYGDTDVEIGEQEARALYDYLNLILPSVYE